MGARAPDAEGRRTMPRLCVCWCSGDGPTGTQTLSGSATWPRSPGLAHVLSGRPGAAVPRCPRSRSSAEVLFSPCPAQSGTKLAAPRLRPLRATLPEGHAAICMQLWIWPYTSSGLGCAKRGRLQASERKALTLASRIPPPLSVFGQERTDIAKNFEGRLGARSAR